MRRGPLLTSSSLLGQAAQCAPLATYAATLTTFADAYAIGQMERHLAAFPKLVESIEASSAQPAMRKTSMSSVRSMNTPIIRNQHRLPARRR